MNRHLHLFMVLLLCTMAVGCKKLVEDQQKNAFLKAMTEGYWHVESYNEGTTDITELFSGYAFKFEADGTVSGINEDGSVAGSWTGDIENYTISSHFPTAGDPLKKLNGMWKIINTGDDFVKAEMTTQAGKIVLQLRKR